MNALQLDMARVCVGDHLSIEFAGRSSSSPNERRDVLVTDAHDGRLFCVTSGKVRPGHVAGGSLRIDSDGRAWYQPTMQQPVRRVIAIAVCKVLPFTRAA